MKMGSGSSPDPNIYYRTFFLSHKQKKYQKQGKTPAALYTNLKTVFCINSISHGAVEKNRKLRDRADRRNRMGEVKTRRKRADRWKDPLENVQNHRKIRK